MKKFEVVFKLKVSVKDHLSDFDYGKMCGSIESEILRAGDEAVASCLIDYTSESEIESKDLTERVREG